MFDHNHGVLIMANLFFIMFYCIPQAHSINISAHGKIQKRDIRELAYYHHYKGTESFLISTPGCIIPNYGKKIKFKDAAYRKLSCGERAIFVRKMYDGWQKIKLVFRIDTDKIKKYVNLKKYECCYSFAVRSNETNHEDRRIRYNKCKRFRSGSKTDIEQEVMIVKCYTQTIQPNKTAPSILYEDAYIFVKKQRKRIMKYNEESWNVLLIGMDTMSRARIFKAMPKMVKRLLTQGWLDYRGYQKIGSNTFPNFVSVLTGQKITSIEKACSFGMHKCNNAMVWSTFRSVGYLTAFGEDNLKLPDTFSKFNGFKTAPTHHYMRPFFLTGERLRGNVMCAKHQPSGKHIFDYAYDFANTYKKEKFFGTFWINTFSHNTEYLPSLFENDTINFLEKITGLLNNTFIMLISDHGIRYGEGRIQMESYYEERLPMLFVWVPIDFRSRHEEKYYNLKLNQNRLVTPYDVYLTLVKISNMSRSSMEIQSEACPQCMDLFEEQSPFRTCASAGVSEKWCSCHGMKNADTFTDMDALNSVQLAVAFIQNYTLNIKTLACKKCTPLRLDKVFRVHSYINQENKKNYVIAFQMVEDFPDYINRRRAPTKMSFEATVLKDHNKLTLADSIETISSYNSRGNCVKNGVDRGFCICRVVNCYTFE